MSVCLSIVISSYNYRHIVKVCPINFFFYPLWSYTAEMWLEEIFCKKDDCPREGKKRKFQIKNTIVPASIHITIKDDMRVKLILRTILDVFTALTKFMIIMSSGLRFQVSGWKGSADLREIFRSKNAGFSKSCELKLAPIVDTYPGDPYTVLHV